MKWLKSGLGRSSAGDTTSIRFAQLRAMGPDALRSFLAADPRDALAAVRAAAQYGLVEAQTMYGQMLLDGTHLPADHAAALRWFKAASGGRHPEAINMVGRCHDLGWA